MGVLGLWELLNSIGHPIKLEGLEGKVLGVDANIWLYKFIRGFREKDNATYNIESHKLGLYNRICKLLFYRIKPVFVFDGPAPVLKRRTLERRQNFRNKNLSKVQDAAMKALALQLKSQYPNANIDDLKIHLPELKSNYLVAAEKMTEEDDDLFYLPPHVRNEDPLKGSDSEGEDISSSEGEDEKFVQYLGEAQGKHKIDIHSEDFKQLPAEVRYEILHDIQESTKRLKRNESLPEDAGSFSSFQVQRLKARRLVQEKIEECQKDICANFAGGLADGHTISAFRMQSDATSTLLYRKNQPETSRQNPFDNYETHKATPKVDTSDDKSASTNDESQSGIRVFRPSLKLLFEEKKPDANFIRLPGSISTSSKKRKVSTDEGPSLSPVRETDESSNPSTQSEAKQTDSESECSTIIEKEKSKELSSTSSSSSESSDDLEVIEDNEDDLNACSSELENSSVHNDKAPLPPKTNTTIELDSDNEFPDQRKSVRRDSVVDLTESLAEDSDVEESPCNRSKSPPTKKANLTIEISDDEEPVNISTNATSNKPTQATTKPPIAQSTLVESSKSDKEPRLPTDETSSKSQPVEVVGSPAKVSPAAQPKADANTSSSQPVVSTSTHTAASTKPDNASKISDLLAAQKSSANLVADVQRASNKVTSKIIEDAKELLRIFGIPYIDAAGEAEAQCALLEELKLTEGTITDDSDIWLFGSQCVYRHFFSDDKYVMQYKMADIVYQLGMTREYLVCFAMLVGSDYTDGIMNVGPVTAMEILSEFEGEGLDPLCKFKDWHQTTQADKTLVGTKKKKGFLKFILPDEFPSRAVYDGYLKPVADSSREEFTWGTPDLDQLREYAQRNFAWDQKKIDEKLVPVMKKLNEKKLQRTIDTFFFKTQANRNPELFRSKRVNQALNKIAKRTARDVKVAAPPAATDEPVNLSEDED